MLKDSKKKSLVLYQNLYVLKFNFCYYIMFLVCEFLFFFLQIFIQCVELLIFGHNCDERIRWQLCSFPKTTVMSKSHYVYL